MILEKEEIAGPSFSYNPEINYTFEYQDWWLDSGANKCVCFGCGYCKSFQISSRGSVTLGNGSVAPILGLGDINLKITFEKILTLKDV